MAAPVLVFGQPTPKWELTLMSAQQRFSALAPADTVVVSVKAFQAGQPLNPSLGTGQLAFMPSPLAQPASGNWNAASWDQNAIGEYVLETAIGSAGAIQLAVGTWWVWAQVTLGTADVIRQVGSIVVE